MALCYLIKKTILTLLRFAFSYITLLDAFVVKGLSGLSYRRTAITTLSSIIVSDFLLMSAPIEQSPDVFAVSVKIQPPWKSDIEAWLSVVESQFASKGIVAEKTKFHHVVASLTEDLVARLRHIIVAPPAESPYTVLKTALIRQSAITSTQRYNALFNEEELGDERPSQLLQRLQALSVNQDVSECNIQHLFTQKLPPVVRASLATLPPTLPLVELGEYADRIFAAHPGHPSVAAVTSPPQTLTNDEVQELRDLRHQMRNLLENKDRSQRQRRPPMAVNTSKQDDTLCWYHQWFGPKARSCRSPCTWSGNGEARQ